MGKTVCIYKLSPWRKEYVRNSDSIDITELKHGHGRNKFVRFPSGHWGISQEELMEMEAGIQRVKIHTIQASESVPVDILGRESIPEYTPEAILKRLRKEVGCGYRETIDDPWTENNLNPSKIFRTTSCVGFYFDTGVPDLLRRTLDPEYTMRIEKENRETARDLHIKSEELRMSNARLKKSSEELKQTKSILDGPIIGLLLYRLRQWWKNKNIKEKS